MQPCLHGSLRRFCRAAAVLQQIAAGFREKLDRKTHLFRKENRQLPFCMDRRGQKRREALPRLAPQPDLKILYSLKLQDSRRQTPSSGTLLNQLLRSSI